MNIVHTLAIILEINPECFDDRTYINLICCCKYLYQLESGYEHNRRYKFKEFYKTKLLHHRVSKLYYIPNIIAMSSKIRSGPKKVVICGNHKIDNLPNTITHLYLRNFGKNTINTLSEISKSIYFLSMKNVNLQYYTVITKIPDHILQLELVFISQDIEQIQKMKQLTYIKLEFFDIYGPLLQLDGLVNLVYLELLNYYGQVVLPDSLIELKLLDDLRRSIKVNHNIKWPSKLKYLTFNIKNNLSCLPISAQQITVVENTALPYYPFGNNKRSTVSQLRELLTVHKETSDNIDQKMDYIAGFARNTIDKFGYQMTDDHIEFAKKIFQIKVKNDNIRNLNDMQDILEQSLFLNIHGFLDFKNNIVSYVKKLDDLMSNSVVKVVSFDNNHEWWSHMKI